MSCRSFQTSGLILTAGVILALAAAEPVQAASQTDLPRVTVASVLRVSHNGEHNAFTDLVRFKDNFYLAFRSCPDGHMVHPSSSIIILASKDRRDWRQVYRFGVKERDTRDPHFLVFRDRLFVYTGTWYCGAGSPRPEDYDLNRHQGYAVWSEDGFSWHGPEALKGTFGHYVWRAGTYGGKAYLCARRNRGLGLAGRAKTEQVESLLLESEDGLVWRKIGVFQEVNGDETAFIFERGGSILAIARRGSHPAQLLRSTPPYDSWERSDLDRYVGGPLLARWGSHLLVAGRRLTDSGPKTSLCWLVDGRLREFAQLPSGGDNSYPGFAELESGYALISYYSSHEQNAYGRPITAIYIAEIQIQE